MTAMTQLGNYQLIKELGRGGMGVVYEGVDTRLDRRVAIKTIELPSDDVSPEAYAELVTRFRTEAKAIARLSHPNIVGVYDVGEQEGRQYMVMELLQGRSVAQLLKAYSPLPVDLTIRTAVQTLSALDYAHEQGIIHRDVKPANIIVLDNGTAKLMDFGIARLETGSAGMTKAGHILGSLLYISPEQLVNAAKIDRRADIYSMAVTMYEMLTGRLPYEGDNIGELVMAIMQSQPPRPAQVNPQVTEALEAIILKAMAKEADKRYTRASEMADVLSALGSGGVAAGPTGTGALGGTTQVGANTSVEASLTAAGQPVSIALGINEYQLVEGVDAVTPFNLVHRVVSNWQVTNLGNKSPADTLFGSINAGETYALIVNNKLILLLYKGLIIDAVTMDGDLTGQAAFETLGASAMFELVKCVPSEPKEPWVVILSAMLGSAKLSNQHAIRSTSQATDLFNALRKEKLTGFVRQADGLQVRYQAFVEGEKAFAVLLPDTYTAAERDNATEVDVYTPRPQLIGLSLRKGLTETVFEVISKSVNRPSLKQLALQKEAKVAAEQLEEAIRNTDLALVGAPDRVIPVADMSFKYADILRDLPPCRIARWLIEGHLYQAVRSSKPDKAKMATSWIWHLKSLRMAQTLRTSDGNLSFDMIGYDTNEKLCFLMRQGRTGGRDELEQFVNDVAAIKRLMPELASIRAGLFLAAQPFDGEVTAYYEKATAKGFGLGSLFGGGTAPGWVATKQGGGFVLNLAVDGEQGLEMMAPNLA